MTNLRLRRPLERNPSARLRTQVYRNYALDAPNVWELDVPLTAIEEAANLFKGGALAARCAELTASGEWHMRLQTSSGNFFAMRARGPLELRGIPGVQGLEGDWRSDLVWVSVDDSPTHERFAALFRKLDVERHLQDKCDHIECLRMYSAFFVVRTKCEAAYFHTDWNIDVHTNAFTMSEHSPIGPLHPIAAIALLDFGEGTEVNSPVCARPNEAACDCVCYYES